MDRHFLVAVSGDKSALHGIRFLGSFFSDKRLIRSTFFYSSSKPQASWEDEKGLEARVRQRGQEKELVAQGKQALETAATKGIDLGFLKEKFSRKLQTSIFSTVTDIIQEGEAGRYDAVVLGRRSLGLLESAFETSVSRALFQERFRFPLWLCRSIEPGRKNVLFYGDGSENSFTMADHVGFVTGREKRHQVDILLEKNICKEDSVKKRYESILRGHGLAEKRLSWIPQIQGNPARGILKLARENAYAAVALGHKNQEKNLLSRLFKGPVSSVVFKELEHAALWICH